MEYVRFGSAGVKVSRIALGTSLRGQADEAAAERMIHRALDRGINLFDCANVYSPGGDRASREAGVAYAANAGRSEEVLGRALKGHRDDAVITCKVYQPVGPGPNDSGASRYHILREIDRSLRRLQTDHVDVYFLHRFDPDTPLEESLRAMETVVQQGKARYVGVSQYQAWQVMRALGIQERLNAAPLITVQNAYSLLDRRLEGEMFPLVRAMGLGVMVYAPLATGLLSGSYHPGQPPPPNTLWGDTRREFYEATIAGRPSEVIAAVHDVAWRSGATMAQVGLPWVLSHAEITAAISGADTAEQIDENAGALDVQIASEDLQRLNDLSAGLGLILDGPQFRTPLGGTARR